MHLYKCLAQVRVLQIPLVLFGRLGGGGGLPLQQPLWKRYFSTGLEGQSKLQPIRCSPSEHQDISPIRCSPSEHQDISPIRCSPSEHHDISPIRCSPSEHHDIRLQRNDSVFQMHSQQQLIETFYAWLSGVQLAICYQKEITHCLTVLTSSIWSL
ncbi:hypothetical protein BsWGS_20208 [Bradybaena similaris]